MGIKVILPGRTVVRIKACNVGKALSTELVLLSSHGGGFIIAIVVMVTFNKTTRTCFFPHLH